MSKRRSIAGERRPKSKRVSLFLRPSPDSISDWADKRVSFLDLDPDSETDSLFRHFQHHLRETTSLHRRDTSSGRFRDTTSFQTLPSPFLPSRSTLYSPEMAFGVSYPRRPADAPLCASSSDLRLPSSVDDLQDLPPPVPPKPKNAGLLFRGVRKHSSMASVRSAAFSKRPGDRSSIESTSSSGHTFESDTGASTASSDTTDSLHSPPVDPEPSKPAEQDMQPPSFAATYPVLSQISLADVDVPPVKLEYGIDLQAMESDNCQLLELLRVKGSPSFLDWDWISETPKKILDVGLGHRDWLRAASTAAPSARIHQINIAESWSYLLGDPDKLSSHLIRGLPFKDGEFDYVRLSGYTFVVPNHCLHNLVKELSRVLCTGGRLEIIEEEVVFPMVTPANVEQGSSPGVLSPVSSKADAGSVYGSESESDDSTATPLASSTSTITQESSQGSARPYVDELEQWHLMSGHCKYMEALFNRMLTKLCLEPRTPSLMRDALTFAFGAKKGSYRELRPIQLHLPSRQYIDSLRPHTSAPTPPSPAPARPSNVSKLSRFLGEKVAAPERERDALLSALAISGADSAPSTFFGTYSPPGLVATRKGEAALLLDMDPKTLEAHATRFPRVLQGAYNLQIRAQLRAKQARAGEGQSDEDTLLEHDVKEDIWDYQTFHRRRLNLPGGDFMLDGDDERPQLQPQPQPKLRRGPDRRPPPRATTSPSPSTNRHGLPHSSALPPGKGLTLVRSFRIYSAVKR